MSADSEPSVAHITRLNIRSLVRSEWPCPVTLIKGAGRAHDAPGLAGDPEVLAQAGELEARPRTVGT